MSDDTMFWLIIACGIFVVANIVALLSLSTAVRKLRQQDEIIEKLSNGGFSEIQENLEGDLVDEHMPVFDINNGGGVTVLENIHTVGNGPNADREGRLKKLAADAERELFIDRFKEVGDYLRMQRMYEELIDEFDIRDTIASGTIIPTSSIGRMENAENVIDMDVTFCNASDIMQVFGKNLKMLREQKGIKQDDFAKQVGVARARISEYENGKGNATLAMVGKIMNALDATLMDMFKRV